MFKAFVLSVVVSASGLAMAGPTFAQSLCRGPPPRAGSELRGPVLQIDDRSSLCIARGAGPSAWSLVRLADAAPNRNVLMALAFGRNAICVIARDGRAQCQIDGKALAGEWGRPAVIDAANRWR